jgi:hypothetical protein
MGCSNHVRHNTYAAMRRNTNAALTNMPKWNNPTGPEEDRTMLAVNQEDF